jgi:ectoine hydroxylase-related dioxygenase (phytanoyl-CoA dioxygenase family)
VRVAIRPAAESAVFGPTLDETTLDALELCYRENGFVVLRGVLTDQLIDQMEFECVRAQQQVVSGEVDSRHGSVIFLDDATKAERFANYVEYVSELSPAVDGATNHPALLAALHRAIGPDIWLRDRNLFGVVYQDARTGDESGYSRIGWHSDWQSGPSLDVWPATAFTFHIDGTSPANGYLRVVPGSHRWATPAPFRNINDVPVPDSARRVGGYTDTPPPFEMPLSFESIPGEIPVYCERGDVLLHDCYLWHSAARATVDHAIRRHVRGSYLAGDRADADIEQFIKNAAR